jgi:putative ABC transport system permease protein
VRNWEVFVRSRLTIPGLTPERELRIIRELAAQLDDFYRDALARGATEVEADADACQQIADWDRMAQDVWLADRPQARPRIDRLTDRIEIIAERRRGGWNVMADVLRDMRYAVRQLVKAPGFTIVAVLTLALGIGATSAIFSVVNGVLLRPLPYPDPDDLVRVYEVVPQHGRFAVAPATFLDWRTQNSVFERIAAYSSGGAAALAGTEGPERVGFASVSWDTFELLKVSPVLGRGFTAEEEMPGKANVIILSHGAWQRRFGGDPGILGRTVNLAGTPATIVGVMPAGFYFPTRDAELWVPMTINPANAPRGAHFLSVLARKKPGVSTDQAHAEMTTITERLAARYPDSSANESAEVILLHEQIVGGIRRALMTLFAAVAVVVLIACANVANLLLVRASVREKEIAIRAAIGAGRRRLVLQMLAESLVLSLAGGGLGLLLAYLAIPSIQTLSAGSIPRVLDVTIDTRVLAFGFLSSVAVGIVFGLAPAWHVTRTTLGDVLKEGGRGSSSSGGRWARNGLLILEVALSIVLLVGATLLLRSFARLTSVDPGFKPEGVLTFQVALPRPSYPQPHNRVAFYDTLLTKLEALPQVTSAGMVQTLPMRGGYFLSAAIQGRPPAKAGEEISASHRVASPGYFATLGIPLLRGRTFTDHDSEKAPMVAVIDEAFATHHFPNEDPIGRGLDIGNGTDGFYEIVGIVGSVHYEGLDSDPSPTMYVPYRQDIFSGMWLVARTTDDPAQLTSTVRQLVREIDPALPAFGLGPLTDVISESLAQRRFSMLLLAVFALIAVFLAAVGLYGVVAYTVSQRTQEIGVRMAIGADRSDVLKMVVRGGMTLALVGVAIGLLGALVLARVVASMLFEVTPFDPTSYAATAAILLAVAVLACYVPARRATRVDPLVALRH